MPERRNTAPLTVEKRAKKREFWSTMVMFSLIFICTPWLCYAWERTTGVTFSTRRVAGRLSTPESLSSTFDKAVAMTIAGLPFALLSLTKRREYL